MPIACEWRGDFNNAELSALHAEAFDHEPNEDDWEAQLGRHSLGWVCARDGEGLVGFVNVAGDGGVDAFVLDTLAAIPARRQGIGTRLVALAAEGARGAGCEWLHVDFEENHESFYFGACGFSLAPAGLIQL